MQALELLPDGTFALRDGVNEWRTRRPKIGEWRQVVEFLQGVDDQAAAAEAVPAEDRTAARNAFVLAGGYSTAMAYTLNLLGAAPAAEVTAEDLPVWCTTPDPMRRILAHWREVPLDLSYTPTTPTPADGPTEPSLSLAP